MKYLVILTKSPLVVDQLTKSFKLGEDGVTRTDHGAATSSNNDAAYGLIPPTYCDLGYYYCAVTYIESADVEPYRLVIA